MHRTAFDLPLPGDPARRVASAWLLLGLASLVGAGVFSLLLVLARTPLIQNWLPIAGLFRVALVIHVNLSVLIWLLSIAGVIWSLTCRNTRPLLDRLAIGLAVVGAVTLALSPLAGATEPLMNNYVPVLDHPVFHAGLGLFAAGVALHVLRTWTSARPVSGAAPPSPTGALREGARLAAGVTAVAMAAVGASLALLPDGLPALVHYEILFWGGGHVLQYTHTLLMMVAWVVLADAGGCRFRSGPRTTMTLFRVLALPVVLAPLIYLAFPVEGPGHRQAFTDLMRYGGLSCLPLGLAVLLSLRGTERPEGDQACLRSALLASMTLFATGGLLGFLIAGRDIVIPAHYHGSTVGVTIAFMGLTYHLLPRLGLGRIPGRMATWQPMIYASGQMMHIAGLIWTGGYGAQRKTPAFDGGLEGIGHLAGMGLMGLGGAVSVTGGLLFLVVCWRAIRARSRFDRPAPATERTAA